MNLHINGIEVKTVSLNVEALIARGYEEKDIIPAQARKFRTKLVLEPYTRRKIFKTQPATLVLERAPSDPTLAVLFEPGIEVRVGRRKFRVYRRDSRLNKIWLVAI